MCRASGFGGGWARRTYVARQTSAHLVIVGREWGKAGLEDFLEIKAIAGYDAA